MDSEQTVYFAESLPRELKDSEIKYRGHRDKIFTHLILMDYDWMHYRIQAEIPVDDRKVMLIEFKDMGTVIAEMTVQISQKYVTLNFDSAIFDELLGKYLELHMSALKLHQAFYGGDLILEYYNRVMREYKDIEFKSQPIILPQQ